MNPYEALEKKVLTEENTLLMQACQDPYGKRKWIHDKPRKISEAKCIDTPYQKVQLLEDIFEFNVFPVK